MKKSKYEQVNSLMFGMLKNEFDTNETRMMLI